ncbi:MAG: MBL fold metallo-hydrolase [Deltaproteobacteria bacterium]|nr:MAG: MBL fold metallo-hydrolase [Deltaproteobacteria bacterium]
MMSFFGCSPILPIEHPTPPENNSEISEQIAQDLKIYVIDVGQGDATLIVGPLGRTLLIDSGPAESGHRAIIPLLNTLHIDTIHWMVLTHYDADHIGGLREVLSGDDEILGTYDDLYPIFGLYDRGEETDKNTFTYQNYTQITDPVRRTIAPGTVMDLGDGATAQVIVVNGHYSDDSHIHLNPNEENEASIGLLIQYGHFKYFTAGDLPGGGSPGGFETKDLESHVGEIIGDIDVLHAGHHGSASSSNDFFLKTIKPESVIISVGLNNDYHHPAETTLNRIEAIGSEVFRTDLRGRILIESDGNQYEIK